MIAAPARAAVRPWLLGAWVVVTAWLTVLSLTAPTLLPAGSLGAGAIGAWMLATIAIHVTSKRRRTSRSNAMSGQRLAVPLLAAATMLVISLILAPAMPLLARIGLALGAGMVPASLLPLTVRIARRSRLTAGGTAIAHLGAALVLVGLACATGLSSEQSVIARAEAPARTGPWLIDYQSVIPVAGPDFTAIEAEVRVTRGNGVSVLRPQLRTAISSTSERGAPAIVTAWTGRLSIALGQARGDGRALLVSWMPFVTLMWLGGVLMALGGAIALAGLRGSRVALIAGALAAAAAGYPFVASPTDVGAAPAAALPHVGPSLVEQRGAFLGQFHRSSHWLIISDSYAARGQTRDAVAILQAATRQHPRDYALWLGLGNALTAHGRGLNPAARLAFARSTQLAPTSPAPHYFLGLAKLQSGDRVGALVDWKRVLANAPADASWRPIVEDGVVSIERGNTPR